MKKNIILCLFYLISVLQVIGQNLYALNALWDDDLKQWTIICDEGNLEGSIEMRWRMRNDISVWDYSFDGIRGTINQVWDNNPNFWELRSGPDIISMSTVFTGDFNSFRIKQGDRSIIIERTHFNADPIEWTISNEKDGRFFWYNEFEYDLRDWIIVDELSDAYTFEMKLASVFTSVLFSILRQ